MTSVSGGPSPPTFFELEQRVVQPTSLDAAQIAGLLERQQRIGNVPETVPVHELFEEILRIADRFVPSEAGSVLLDEPLAKLRSGGSPVDSELVFVACYGPKASELLGRRIPVDQGLAGRTYLSGRPQISSNVVGDERFFAEIDAEIDHLTRSIVSVPIRIGRSTCGVLELINRKDKASYVESELELLQIFAGYISTSLQNLLDANRYRELAKRDDLTGLYNDRYFNQSLSEALEGALEGGGDLGLIFLDLDHFKQVNDTHGHLVGSATLREVGLILAGAVRPEGAVVARYGGDEFVVFVPHYDLDATLQLAEDIRRRIEATVFCIDAGLGESTVTLMSGAITASIGVASYRNLDLGPDRTLNARKNELIRGADQSMYRAKALGKNRVCHEPHHTGLDSSTFAAADLGRTRSRT